MYKHKSKYTSNVQTCVSKMLCTEHVRQRTSKRTDERINLLIKPFPVNLIKDNEGVN